MYSMMEKDVKVECRKKDKEAVEKAVEEAKKEFEGEAKFSIKTEVHAELSDDLCVGALSTLQRLPTQRRAGPEASS